MSGVRASARRRRTPELLAGFWFVTSGVALSGVVLAVLTVVLDKFAGNAGALPGLVISPDSARTILGSIAGSLITIASLTSSLTIVTLQLLSSQYTPRAVRGFLATRLAQYVLGSFIGIFLFCLVVLVTVREPGDENEPFVPSLGIVVSVVLAVVGLIMLVVFIHSMSQTIQVSTMTARIARDTFAAIAAEHESVVAGPRPEVGDRPVSIVLSPAAGYVRDVDVALLERELPGVAAVHVCTRPGEFVTPQSRIAEVSVSPAERLGEDVERIVRLAVDVQRERDIRGDPGYGMRQLVDIALRALSPGINDPSTAVTCVGYLRALLEDLAGRTLPELVVSDAGATIVSRPLAGFDAYLAPVVEIASYAAGDARVVRTLLDALDGVAAACADDHRAAHVRDVRDQIREASLAEVRLPVDRARLADG